MTTEHMPFLDVDRITVNDIGRYRIISCGASVCRVVTTLAGEPSVDAMLPSFPGLSSEDVRAALRFVAGLAKDLSHVPPATADILAEYTAIAERRHPAKAHPHGVNATVAEIVGHLADSLDIVELEAHYALPFEIRGATIDYCARLLRCFEAFAFERALELYRRGYRPPRR